MMSKDQATDLRGKTAVVLSRLQARRDAFLAERKRIEADNSRHPSYINEKVEEARNAAFRDYSDMHRQVQEAARMAALERPKWANTLLVLSRQKFSNDVMEDATVAMRTLTELSSMPGGLLQATADVAREEGQFARLYQAVLIGQKFHREAFAVELSKLELPEQSSTLEALDETIAMNAAADIVINQTSANPKMGVELLDLARRSMPGGVGPKGGDEFMDPNRFASSH